MEDSIQKIQSNSEMSNCGSTMDKDVPKSTELVKDNLQMGAKAGSESPKMPYKEYTGRVPMAPGFGKRFQFRKTNSATFKLDGMHYTIGMY